MGGGVLLNMAFRGKYYPSPVPRSQRLVTRRGALGLNSKAVHRAYAKRALMKIPSLEDYEERAAMKTVLTG
jgi:hypothetical protein